LEEDWFYNGVNARAHLDLNGAQVADADATLNSAAFMTNFLLRYAPHGGCGLQPYILGGIGGWWGETGGDIDVTVGNTRINAGSRDNGGFAFQVGAGVDYYFSPKWSIYTEYKFLDYTNAGNEFTNSNVGQHLVGAGFRVHF
jgi:outer membrane autotransporter protein